MKIVVAVPTRGTRNLGALFEALGAQSSELSHECSVLIVHNAESSEALLAECKRNGFRYVAENKQGYATVRNRILDETKDADAIAMIDDNEIPCEAWLSRLVSSLERGADVVTGPVVQAWPPGTPGWIRRADLPPRIRTAPARVGDVATNNTIVRRSSIRDVRYDERFNVTSGEDTVFFREILSGGAVAAWRDDALVYEHPDAEETTPRYYIARAFRQGRNAKRIREAVPGWQPDRTPSAEIAHRCRRAVELVVRAVVARDGAHLLRSAWELSFAAGLVVGRAS